MWTSFEWMARGLEGLFDALIQTFNGHAETCSSSARCEQPGGTGMALPLHVELAHNP